MKISSEWDYRIIGLYHFSPRFYYVKHRISAFHETSTANQQQLSSSRPKLHFKLQLNLKILWNCNDCIATMKDTNCEIPNSKRNTTCSYSKIKICKDFTCTDKKENCRRILRSQRQINSPRNCKLGIRKENIDGRVKI